MDISKGYTLSPNWQEIKEEYNRVVVREKNFNLKIYLPAMAIWLIISILPMILIDTDGQNRGLLLLGLFAWIVISIIGWAKWVSSRWNKKDSPDKISDFIYYTLILEAIAKGESNSTRVNESYILNYFLNYTFDPPPYFKKINNGFFDDGRKSMNELELREYIQWLVNEQVVIIKNDGSYGLV